MADQFLDQPPGVPRSSLLLPTAVKAASLGRNTGSASGLASLTSGRQSFQLIYLEAGTPVTNLTFSSWTTALAAGTNQWFSLYDINRIKLAVTADDTSAAWNAFTTKTLALSAPYMVTASGLYYAGICVVASTVPSLAGGVMPDGYNLAVPINHGHDATNTGLTNPASAPATAAALTKSTAPGTLLVYVT